MYASLESTDAPVDGVRLITIVNAIFWTLLALGLFVESPLATWIWPWDAATMTYIFFASIAAAVAGPLIWIALVDEPSALSGVSLDGAVIGILFTIALLTIAISESEWRLLVFAAGTIPFAIGTAYVFQRFHPVPPRDTAPQPIVVRVVFLVVVILLVPIGISLMFRVDGIFPWNLPGHTSTMIGAMFIGAATYFAYGVWRNSWAHSGGQLAGLLAYDLVLAVPYWRTVFDRDAMSGSGGYQSFPGQVVPGQTDSVNDNSLYVYTTVITVSGLVAIYYLFVSKQTRMFKRPTQTI